MLKNKIPEITEYAKTHSVKEIAREFDIASPYIYLFLRQNSIRYRKKHTVMITDDLIEYCKNHTLDEIYKNYNVNYKFIHDNNIEFKRLSYISDTTRNIVLCKGRGDMQSDIAKKFNVTRQYVSMVCNKYIIEDGNVVRRAENGK